MVYKDGKVKTKFKEIHFLSKILLMKLDFKQKQLEKSNRKNNILKEDQINIISIRKNNRISFLLSKM